MPNDVDLMITLGAVGAGGWLVAWLRSRTIHWQRVEIEAKGREIDALRESNQILRASLRDRVKP